MTYPNPYPNVDTNLPAIPNPIHVGPAPPPMFDYDPEMAGGAVPLSHYLWILRRHLWKILGFIAVCVAGTLLVSLRLTPIYESTTTIDVDRRMPTGVLGQESTQSTLNDADQFLATQVKLIQSDSVLRPVVDRFKLREVEKDALEEQASDLKGDDAPVILKRLRVTRPPNTYLLLVSYRSPNRQLASDVANSIALSYLTHTYNIRFKAAAGLSEFMERQLEELRAKMERSSSALAQFERELNVISPEEKTNILSARLLQLNTEYTNAQGDRVKKEAAYTSIKSGTLAAAQVSSQGEALKKLTENFNEAQEKFAEVQGHFGINHPEYKRAQTRVNELRSQLESTTASIGQRVEIEYREAVNREAMLEKAVKQTKAEFDGLHARSFEYQTLKREAEGDKKLYEELVRKIKEAGINASFQNSSIRVADPARPGLKAVFPKIWLNLLIAFLVSTGLAVGAAVVIDVIDNTVRDPDQVAKLLKTNVIGSLPAVRTWRRHLGPVPIASGDEDGGVLAGSRNIALAHVNAHAEEGIGNYEEAIRTLRNSILLTDFDRRLRSILLTSASPSEGKSTVAAHLAAIHAAQRKRTLLIDGDLRRPSVHRLFQLPNQKGLSNVLMGDIPWRSAVQHLNGKVGLDILPAGPSTRRASDLMGTGLADLIDEATREYDLVILDAPPLLGFAEPLQMATVVDGVIVVARAGDTSRKALASVIQVLGRLRANTLGIVLNEVHRQMSSGYYYYYGHYSKYYRQAAED
ncbi:MAG: polysaccharide biosynthesis tyrosine autokinase [Bryobacteraceae bacterium]